MSRTRASAAYSSVSSKQATQGLNYVRLRTLEDRAENPSTEPLIAKAGGAEPLVRLLKDGI